MANIKDVAKRAGVGVGTVSRYLNKSDQISETAKEKIRKAIKETGYIRNELGRNLKTNNPRNIALLIPSIFHNFFSAFALYTEIEFSKHDYKVMICNSLSDIKKDKGYIDMLEEGKLSGIIGFTFTEIYDVIHENMNYVSIDRNFDDKVTVVSSDNFGGGRLAAQTLRESGCKNIGFVGTYSNIIDTEVKNRRLGFKAYAEEHNIHHFEHIGEDPIRDYESFFNVLFDNYLKNVDGLFFENDNLALEFIERAFRKGVRIPEDISVIGYDGVFFSQAIKHNLTTIVQPLEEIAKIASEKLIHQIENKNGIIKPEKIIVPINIRIGSTTK